MRSNPTAYQGLLRRHGGGLNTRSLHIGQCAVGIFTGVFPPAVLCYTVRMDITETTLDSERIYEFPPYSLVKDTIRLPDDKIATRTFVTHPGGVAVLAVNEHGLVSFVRQVRHPIGQETLELPAGKLDGCERETKAEAAIRELREETGLSCEDIIELGPIYPSPAITNEVITLFFARGLHAGTQDLDDDEFINTTWLSMDEIRAKILSHEITDAKTICAFAMAGLRGLLRNGVK